MAFYNVPDTQEQNVRRNDKAEGQAAVKEKTYSREEVLQLLAEAKEVNNG